MNTPAKTLIEQTFDAQQAYRAYADRIDPTRPQLGQSDDLYKLLVAQQLLQAHVGGQVFLLPAVNLPVLETKLAKLNKRAAKLDVTPITITTEQAEPITIEHGEHKGEVFERTFVIVHGSTPKLDGWSFVATLEHDEGAVILRRLPTFEGEVDLSPYTHATPENCDHCGVKRYRKDTYIVSHDDGTLKQVGSTCLGDFLGRGNPQAIARYCEYIADWVEDLSNSEQDYEGGSGPRFEKRIDLDYFLGHVACQIRNHGWTSKGAARDSYTLVATAERAQDNITRERTRDRKWPADEVLGEDIGLANEAIAWVRNLSEEAIQPTSRGDYLWNLAAVISKDSIRYRQTGIAASAINAYQREISRQAERQAQTQAGSSVIEGKGTITGTIVKVDVHENEFGARQVMIVLDDRGFKVWGTVPASIIARPSQNGDGTWAEGIGAEPGARVQFNATVTKSDRDDTFGFFKRPTQATIIEAAPVAEEAS